MAYSASVMDLPPSHLYKYRSFDVGDAGRKPFTRDREIIDDNVVWASSPLSFNDPFDCIPSIDLTGSAAEREAYAKRASERHGAGLPRAERRQAKTRLKKALKNQFNMTEAQGIELWIKQLPHIGVFCLAERPDDMLMWSYYSNSHEGYCLEFKTDTEPMMQAHRVIYDKDRPTFRPLDPDRSELMEKTLLRKADFWEHEREWRIVSRPVGQLAFPAQSLTAVVLGARIKPEQEQIFRDIAERRMPYVEVRRALLDRREFRLSITSA